MAIQSKSKTPSVKKTCDQCKKELAIVNFYNTNSVLSSDGKLNICKSCVVDMIDYKNMETVYKILQLLDVPFIHNYWVTSMEKNPQNPWGTYITMANSKINEFRYSSWKDSKFEEVNDYDTSNITDSIIEKWGFGYSNLEYTAFEKKYWLLKNNYPEKTAMHTEALLNYIRYRVKEEQSTALGEVKDAKDWGELANKAATAAKINPSQLSKSDLTDGLSTFGELVRATEQAVDIIEILPKFKQRPQDKVDFTLWCYINYVRDLKGLPPCTYQEIYEFYEERKREYSKHGDSHIFDEDTEEEDD